MNDSGVVFTYGRVEMMDAVVDVDKGEGGKRKARSNWGGIGCTLNSYGRN